VSGGGDALFARFEALLGCLPAARAEAAFARDAERRSDDRKCPATAYPASPPIDDRGLRRPSR
jgi:hypothetical protein